MSKPYLVVMVNTHYIHLCHSLTLKVGKKLPLLSFPSFPPPRHKMALKFIMYWFCWNTSKNGSLVRISSRLKFTCHGWVHWLSSPQSLLKRREGWTIIHFCTHSFHSPEPARPLTWLCWSPAHCWPSSVEPDPEWWTLAEYIVGHSPSVWHPGRGR